MHTKKTSILTIALAILFVSGCTSDQPSPEPETEVIGDLPSISSTGNCTETPSSPSICVWSKSADAVVFGTVKNIKLVDSDIVSENGEVMSTCDGVINYGIEITLGEVVSNSTDVGQTITFRVGTDVASTWSPVPARNQSGEFTWNSKGGLKVGQGLGAALHWLSNEQLWTLSGEALFTKKTNGLVTFQQGGVDSCIGITPTGANSMSLAELITEASSCTNTDQALVDARNRVMVNSGSVSPTRTFASECVSSEIGPN